MPTNPLSIAARFALNDAGQDWDAIRVPQPLGVAAMSILGGRCGAVLEDPHANVVYYFVPAGTAAQWEVEHTRAISDGGTVAIPLHCTNGPGPHWRICPGDGGWFTDARALRAALEDCHHLGGGPPYRWEDRLGTDSYPPVTGLWWVAHAKGHLAWDLLRSDDGEVIGKTVRAVLPPSS